MDYLTNDTDLTSVADAIRAKSGTTDALEWPTGYVDAIEGISENTYKLTIVVPEQTFTAQEFNNAYQATLTYISGLEDGAAYLVTFDGVEYVCECGLMFGSDLMAGAISYLWNMNTSDVVPFGLDNVPSDNDFAVGVGDTNTHIIKVERLELNASGGNGAESTTKTAG